MLNGIVGEPRRSSCRRSASCTGRPTSDARVPQVVTPELAELVGYFMGDGSLHAKGLRFCVAREDQDVVEHLVDLIAALFGLDATATEKQGYTEVAVNSVPLVLWWEACGFAKLPPSAEHSGKGWHAHIPDAVLHTNDPEVYAAFVRGLFEADGTTDNGYVSWSTVTESFSRDVQTLLLALGFVTTRKIDEPGTNWGLNPRFVLRLLNVAAAERYLEEIDFISVRKAASLWQGDHRQASRHDHIPVSRGIVDELAPENDALRKTMLMALARRGDVSRRSATALLERTADPELEHLLGFYYDSVATVETLDDQPTYDISVPDNVTYVANGFVSHNTISFMMDCDTTGVEPDFSLVKSKKLVGGGEITIVNKTVPMALDRLGYAPDEVEQIVAFIDERNTVVGAPFVKTEHYPIFDCAIGDRAIHYSGHVKMMGAVQPFISGAISKTVNMPESTLEEVMQLVIDAWHLGVKAIAIYRDNCKVAQPLSSRREGDRPGTRARHGARPRAAAAAGRPHRGRPEVPRRRVRGLHPRRPVRRRHARRHLRRHRQGGHDARRPDELVHDLRLARPPVRRAARGVRLEVLAHALRAGGADERPGHPRREVDRRLHLPLDGQEVPHHRPAGGARHPLARGEGAAGGALRERRRGEAGRDGVRGGAARGAPAGPDGALQLARGRSRVRALRRPHGADGLVLHVPGLRHEHRLQRTPPRRR